jgi:hypothetical protein
MRDRFCPFGVARRERWRQHHGWFGPTLHMSPKQKAVEGRQDSPLDRERAAGQAYQNWMTVLPSVIFGGSTALVTFS